MKELQGLPQPKEHPVIDWLCGAATWAITLASVGLIVNGIIFLAKVFGQN